MPEHVLIAGSGGMLGTALQHVAALRGVEIAAPTEAELDITDARAVRACVGAFARRAPGGLFVNAAAYTDVERAEDDSERAFLVNGTAPGSLAEAAVEAGLRFVHVSTDFVFDGVKDGAYAEDDVTNPLSVYGASKLAGELAVRHADPSALVVRTAWVFGPAGENFPVKVLRAARTRPALQVVTGERGSPTYTLDLAAGILDLVDAGAEGLFHLTGSGSCTRYELAVEVLRLAGIGTPVEPAGPGEFPTKASRPANSVLDCSKAAAMGVRMPEWHDALARFVASMEGPPA